MARRSHMDALRAHSGGLLKGERNEEYEPYRGGDWNDEELAPRNIQDAQAYHAPVHEPPPPARPASDNRKRTRLNVSEQSRDCLRDIVHRMRNYGVEKDLRASQVLEALILALDDAKQYIDMSTVGKRGQYGSASHRNFPASLAVSISRAIAASEREKAG